MDPKLAILFLLIGTVIALSHLGDGRARMRLRPALRRWRAIAPRRRKS